MLAFKIFIRFQIIALLVIQSATQLYSQKQREPIEITAGIEARALVPLSSFTMKPLFYSDSLNHFYATGTYTGGMGFGGVIRFKLTDFWNLESGIYYTRRVYNFEIEDPVVEFKDNVPLRLVGYEIPIKGLVYIQLTEDFYMNVALGMSFDFFASDLKIYKPSVSVGAFKQSWLRMAVLGNVGLEYRSEKSGYFYTGITLHQPFNDILMSQVNYYRNNEGQAYFQNRSIDGVYFSIDFRYFIPHKKKTPASDVKYSFPDWKKMR